VKCHYLGIGPSRLEDVIEDRAISGCAGTDYLPAKTDCEMAVAALRKGAKGSSISKEDVFDWLEREFQRREISMKGNWKFITERNLEIWFG
jgi:hypothetical protein